MQFYQFFAPRYGNDGRDYSQALGIFQDELLRLAGGYTVQEPVIGFWRDDATGQVYQDKMVPFLVAFDDPARVEDVLKLMAELFLDQEAFGCAHLGSFTVSRTPEAAPLAANPSAGVTGARTRPNGPHASSLPDLARHRSLMEQG